MFSGQTIVTQVKPNWEKRTREKKNNKRSIEITVGKTGARSGYGRTHSHVYSVFCREYRRDYDYM